MHHGQEIYLFFYRYGKNGIYGIILCSILIGIIIYKTINIVYKEKISTYKDFLNLITPKIENFNKYYYKYIFTSYFFYNDFWIWCVF